MLAEVPSEDGMRPRGVPTLNRVHPSVHGHAADPRLRLRSGANHRIVSRTPVNIHRPNIRINQSRPDQLVVDRRECHTHIAVDPHVVRISRVGPGIGQVGNAECLSPGPNHPIVVVVGIDHGSELQLLQIAHAFDCLCPLLGLAERRQQHGSQDRDDRNHHQQFDEREAADSPSSPPEQVAGRASGL